MAAIWMPASEPEKAHLMGWMVERLPLHYDPAYPIGVVRGGQVVAVCVYHNFRQTNIELTFAADTPRWATKEIITVLLGWPFWMHPSLRRLTAITKRRNIRARKLVEGLGFRCEGTHLDLFADDDGVSYAMTRRWWLRSKWHLPDPEPKQEAA